MPNNREAVILSILINGERFGREIREDYARRAGETMPLGSLYVTLDRMVEKGFLRSRQGDSMPERRGNRRRFFKLTASGIAALNQFQIRQLMVFGAPAHG